MRGFGFACVGLIVFAATGCGFQYEATVECRDCLGMPITSGTGIGCSRAEAISAAEANCRSNGGTPDPNPVVTSIFGFNTCGLQRSPAEAAALPDLVQYAQKQLGLAEEAPGAAATTCPAQKITFKVIVHNEYRPYNTCPNAKEVRVSYEKFVSPGVKETVTISKQVAFGGQQEFTCTDSIVQDEVNGLATVAVAAQAYAGNINECTLFPMEQGQIGQSFIKKLANGGQLVIHEHPETGGFISTITNPGSRAKTGAEAAGVTDLQPIPDPKFSARKR